MKITHNRMVGFHSAPEVPVCTAPVIAKTVDGWIILEHKYNCWVNADKDSPYNVDATDVLYWAHTPELP